MIPAEMAASHRSHAPRRSFAVTVLASVGLALAACGEAAPAKPAPKAEKPPSSPKAPPAAAAPKPQAPEENGDSKQVRVKAGETAGRIAAANLPSNASLDQMLVAMLSA